MTEHSSRPGGAAETPDAGVHVAIIMDGNGRWAQARGRRREWGHRRGAESVRSVVRAAPDLGVGTLTLYAFSSDNWSRPAAEVGLLMRLLERYMRREAAELRDNGVRLRVVGRRDRLDARIVDAIAEAEATTESGDRLDLRIAVDYSSRHALLQAVREAASREGLAADRPDLAAELGRVMHADGPSRDVDLLIRTGGEKRLSDFLLWECAYAEMLFTPVMWPDFSGEHLASALQDFATRDRRFGNVQLAG